jgi:uncharacterized protein YggU (UPF0235/DUF167 family)
VSVLEWVLILEAAVLCIGAILALVAMIIAKQDPDDPIAVFCNTFWREFLWPPQVMEIDTERTVARPLAPSSREGSSRGSGRGEASDDDALYGRTVKDAQGRAKKVDLVVLVEPHAAADEVAGRDDDGIKVRVTGEAGESRANKALVEIVAHAMGVQPYQVTLTKGHYQTRKTVQIQGVSADELEARLANLPDAE